MTFDISLHKTTLFQILKEIYSDTTISPFLGFKGGTAASMFYGLDRLSIDLDFDLLDSTKEKHVFEKIEKITKKYGTMKDMYRKRFNLFFMLSYQEHSRNIKIEINRREFGSQYEIKTYLGVSMLVMRREDMFAHKLMAMYERMGRTNRDIYDVWFFLKNLWPINREIVEKRAGMPFKELIGSCIRSLENLTDRKILAGIGELLTNTQKDWAKANLRKDTISLLKLRLEGGRS